MAMMVSSGDRNGDYDSTNLDLILEPMLEKPNSFFDRSKFLWYNTKKLYTCQVLPTKIPTRATRTVQKSVVGSNFCGAQLLHRQEKVRVLCSELLLFCGKFMQ